MTTTCPYCPHYPGETCECPARLAAVTSHTKTPHESGPPYCAECSEAISEWVTWPCRPTPKPTPPDPTPTLTDEQREALVEALRFDRCEYGCAITYTQEAVRYDLEPVVARMVADAEQRGRAEVSAAVEALADEWESWSRTRSTTRIDAFRDAAERVRATLTDPAAAVARIKAEALREAADDVLTMYDPPVNECIEWSEWLRARADRIGGESDG